MDVSVTDAAFVRAPAELVYRRLTDVAAWPTWWSGLALRPLPPIGRAERWGLELSAGAAFQLRVAQTCVEWRHESGFSFTLDGDLSGRAEFWLEPAASGTVVHHVFTGSTGLYWPTRAVRGYRGSVRRGLWGFKDLLQLEVRTSIGILP